MHPTLASSSLDMKRQAAGEVRLTHGQANSFLSMSKMEFSITLKGIPGGGVLSRFQFSSPKKMSFQTYTLPSPHPLSHDWPCKHTNNTTT